MYIRFHFGNESRRSGADSHQVTPPILLHNKRLNNLQDEFRSSYSDYKKQTAANAVSVGWIALSITPRGTRCRACC